MKRGKTSIIIGAAVAIPLTLASSAMASTVQNTAQDSHLVKSLAALETTRSTATQRSTRRKASSPPDRMNAPRVIGKIVSIYGSTIQMTASNSVTYTADASGAVIRRGFGTNTIPLSVSQLTVGNLVAIVGVSGTPKGVTSFSADRITLLL